MKDKLTKLFGSHLVNLGMLPDDAVIVDVGACVGNFIKDIRKHIKRPHFYAIEPNRKNAEELRTRAIGQSAVIKEVALVGEKEPNRMKFYDIKDLPEWGNVTNLYTSKTHTFYMVHTINLKTLLMRLPTIIHYMKMDIEGSEWDVVNDMNEESAKRIQQLSMEIHINGVKIQKKLERLGYKTLLENGELYGVKEDF